MIERFQKSIGIKLFRIGRWQVEIWVCPKCEVIPPHVHPNVDSRIVWLAGSMMGIIGNRSKQLGWRDVFSSYLIPRNTVHSGVITGLFCCFLNIERWAEKRAVTSASLDFKRV